MILPQDTSDLQPEIVMQRKEDMIKEYVKLLKTFCLKPDFTSKIHLCQHTEPEGKQTTASSSDCMLHCLLVSHSGLRGLSQFFAPGLHSRRQDSLIPPCPVHCRVAKSRLLH